MTASGKSDDSICKVEALQISSRFYPHMKWYHQVSAAAVPLQIPSALIHTWNGIIKQIWVAADPFLPWFMREWHH